MKLNLGLKHAILVVILSLGIYRNPNPNNSCLPKSKIGSFWGPKWHIENDSKNDSTNWKFLENYENSKNQILKGLFRFGTLYLFDFWSSGSSSWMDWGSLQYNSRSFDPNALHSQETFLPISISVLVPNKGRM